MDGEAGSSRTEIVGHSSPPPDQSEPPETVITLSSVAATTSEEGPDGGGGGDPKVRADAVVVEMGKVAVQQRQQEQEWKGEAVDGGGGGFPGPEDKGASVVVDVKCLLDGGSVGGGRGDQEMEKTCRICHVNPERREGGAEGSDLIQLGCGCKGELGMAHRHCAETWFKLKGNRCCEICGLGAKNVTGIEDYNFMEEWNERRTSSSRDNINSSERGRCWRGQPFCNFLMACLVIAFILPWFFRVNMF